MEIKGNKGAGKMLVFECSIKVRVKKDISYERTGGYLTYFLDSALGKNEDMLELHNKREYKFYCFDLLYPCEKDRIYKAGNVYTFRLRTVKQELAEYFSKELLYHESRELKGVHIDMKIIPNRPLERVYSLTPVIIKGDEGYWKNTLHLEQYEERLKVNLLKKYEMLTGEKLEEDFSLYKMIEFKNHVPVKVIYKNIHLLGDKIILYPSSDERARELLYMALGTGLGENNSRGAGFLNYQYVK